jgi:hypothetical protein
VGDGAGRNITSGQGNTLMGSRAGSAVTTGYDNTALGEGAGTSLSDGHDNTIVGELAGSELTTGDNNTLIGQLAMAVATGGSNNIAIGSAAGFDLTSGSHNIYIGNDGVSAESGVIRIGDGDQAKAYLAGVRGTTTDVADGVPVLVDSNGQLGTVSSSARYKEQIESMGAASDVLYDLRPVTFHYREHPAGARLQYGLIAEEVEEVAPDLVVYEDGRPETVLYRFLAPMLLNELQKLRQIIELQEARIERLEAMRH